MTESAYQAKLIKKLGKLLPGCVVLKNDPQYLQGILDLTVLYENQWAMLEVKLSADSPYQPNQEYYIEHLGSMSFTSVIHPENEEEVLHALQGAFASQRTACIPQS